VSAPAQPRRRAERERHVALADEQTLAPADDAGSAPGVFAPALSTVEREERAALASAAGLYFVGASLTATSALLPHVDSPAGVIAIGLTAFATAAALIVARRRAWHRLTVAWLADLWGVVLIALLCASTGGAGSPFGLIYFFAIGHAAAFQRRRRVLDVFLASLAGFLTPLLYGHVPHAYWAIAFVSVVLALLCAAVVHYALERMRDQRWRLEFLINATANLGSSLDPQQTLRKVARTAVPGLADLCVIDLIDADGAITATVAASSDPRVAAAMEHMRREHPLGIRGRHPVADALRGWEPFVRNELDQSAVFARQASSGEDEQARFLRDAGCRAAAVVPMVARGRMLGAMSFLRLGGEGHYEPAQVAMLEDLTGRAALAFDNARLYAERAHVAHTLRRSLMPAKLPDVPGLQLASFFRPTGAGSDVGGDFYDVFTDAEDCWLVVGDVCGKGADAAVLTGFLRHTTLAYAREGVTPSEVLRRVNDAMLDQDFEGRFATAILARLRFAAPDLQLTLAAAGHPPALIARAGGHAEEFGECGTLLGVFDDPVIIESATVLGPGDTLALYTDGLTEAHAPAQVMSVEELLTAITRSAPAAAQGVIDAMVRLLERHEGPPRDDVAVLAAHVSARAGLAARAA
jgi:Stage II sporulation protein E (SpoIIE)/GAF domain